MLGTSSKWVVQFFETNFWDDDHPQYKEFRPWYLYKTFIYICIYIYIYTYYIIYIASQLANDWPFPKLSTLANFQVLRSGGAEVLVSTLRTLGGKEVDPEGS